jgi:hypothetical protein
MVTLVEQPVIIKAIVNINAIAKNMLYLRDEEMFFIIKTSASKIKPSSFLNDKYAQYMKTKYKTF